jgi:3-deoxy-manno-octulosonate cytidylyltransferase (CMP-KDO synthetase)
MIQHVYERALKVEGLKSVYVATDSPQIYDKVLEFGGKVIMTHKDHPSGSDRLAEAARVIGVSEEDIVLNIQGDQPVLNPEHPRLLHKALIRSPDCVMSTLAIPFRNKEDFLNPNHVKVVTSGEGRALYFSRSPIPHAPDGEIPPQAFRHIGLYAFRADFLYKFVKLKRLPLEISESLEQLRALEHGQRIKVVLSEGLSPEVDVPEDIKIAEEAILKEEALAEALRNKAYLEDEENF